MKTLIISIAIIMAAMAVLTSAKPDAIPPAALASLAGKRK
uniref:Venom peptide ECTX1-Rm59a n=1 Tax=Rhytidoponera metallica TaxID=148364 RepID=A0A8U0LTL8_RHYMT|nr:venom peptide precursor ECTX1-Rm59a [Rhytidoponera metallica]UPH34151.1 venom peptide precursor ECTX1-Rm59b [Rhytidoponera metallica]